METLQEKIKSMEAFTSYMLDLKHTFNFFKPL